MTSITWISPRLRTEPKMSSLQFRPPLVSPWKKKKKNQYHSPASLPSMAALQNSNHKPIVLSHLLSFALSITLSSPFPSLAIPSLNSLSSPLSPTTPFSQSKNLPTGLENGYALNLVISTVVQFCY